MNIFKEAVKKTINIIDPHLAEKIQDDRVFKSLKRRPPELIWKAVERSSMNRMDAGGLQLGHLLYVFGGYETINDTLSVVDVLDLQTGKWVNRFKMPAQMAQTHVGMCCDGKRFMYAISGQYGNQCHPATDECFVLDTQTQQWESIPKLPEARYAAATAYWNGRIHVMGGSRPDRNTPATDHWSLGVKDGKPVENRWRKEISIPRGGPHRASVVVDNKLYVFGGQEGDWIALPDDPNYIGIGTLTTEVVYPDTYMLEAGARQWNRMADMPVQSSHTESSYAVIGKYVIFVAGMKDKNAKTHVVTLTDVVQAYDTSTNSWRIIGHTPYRIKSTVVGYDNGWLYMTTGQRDRGPDNPAPGRYYDRTWKARINL